MNVDTLAPGRRTGTLPGEFAVASDGAALYTIPLTVPPGTGGLSPSLALAYTSASGNDLLGIGWQLTGLSSISRTGAIPVLDGFRGGVSYTSNDRFNLDGQRLVNVSGAYGEAGTVYHSELESWRRIVPVYGNSAGLNDSNDGNGPDSFVVYEKNGQVVEFGSSADSRINASNASPLVRSWLVSRITDRNGNFIRFQYIVADGAARIARIDYTGNQGVAPRRSVRFSYEERPDPTTRYVGGFPICSQHRMVSIDTYVDEQRVTRYQLDYLPGGTTGRSRLASITQADTHGNSLTPTRFTWQDSNPLLFSATATESATELPFGGNFLPLDVNGDGRIDFVNAYPVNDLLVMDLYVAHTSGKGFHGPFRVPASSPALPWGGQFFPMDVNGNGHTDLVYAWRDDDACRLAVFLATQDSNKNWNLQMVTAKSSDISLPWGGQLYAADFDGDGATDFVYLQRTDEGTNFSLLTTKDAGFERGQTLKTSLPYDGLCLSFDVDGDGMADIVYAYHVDGKLRIATLKSNGKTLALHEKGLLASLNLDFSGALLPMDFNGDGLVDLVHAGQNSAGNLILTPIVSSGAGFIPLSAQTFNDIPFNSLILPGDLNGDGIADLAISVQSPTGTALHTLVSTGTGFRSTPSNQPLKSMRAGVLFPIDLNGVGRNGLLNLAEVNGKLTLGSVLPSGDAPDLLTTITTGSGATFSMQYRAMTDAEVYQHSSSGLSPTGLLGGGSTAIGATYTPSSGQILAGSTGAVAPVMTAAFPKYVLSSYTKSDGRGNAHEYRYGYSNAAIDIVSGRGWLGFQQQKSCDMDVGTTTLSSFHQQFPLASMMSESTVSRTRDAARLNHTAMHYQILQPDKKTYLPLSSEIVTQLFSFGHLDATQRSTTSYDAYGNPVLSCEFGDGSGAALFTHRGFINDSKNWRLGFKTSEKQTADMEGRKILSSEKTEFSPGLMNAITHSVWHDHQEVWLNAHMSYDMFGNIIAQTDHAGAKKTTVYDSLFHTFPVSAEGPPNADGLSLTTSYEHEPCFGELIRAVDSNKVQTRQRIDGFGRVTAKLGPDNQGKEVELLLTEWKEDDTGAYQENRERFDWQGRRWTCIREYLDGFERVYRTVSLAADGITLVTVDKRYNSRNLVTYETLPWSPGENILSIKRTFDECDRVLRVERPSGDGAVRIDLFSYPDIHTLQLTAGAGSTTERHTTSVQGSYNGKQLPVRIVDGSGNTAQLAYDALGRTIRTEDGVGNITLITYDSLDNKVSAKVSNGTHVSRAETAGYNMLTREVSKQDARGHITVMKLDALGRPLSSIENGKTSTTYCYDDSDDSHGLGRLTSVSLEHGAKYAFVYDAYGNQTKVSVTLGGEKYQFKRSFLPSSRPESIVYPDGAVHDMRYTAGGMLESLTATATNGNREASISIGAYNASGKPASLRHGNGFVETLQYNVAQQLRSQQIVDANKTPVLHQLFKWNAIDDLIAIEDQLDQANSYAFSYDLAGRLLKADGPYARPQQFSYDAAGNLTMKDDASLLYANGLLVGAGKLAFEYDKMGNTTRIKGNGSNQELDYDVAGKLTTASGCSFTYDHQGRRLSKRLPDGSTTWYIAPDYEVVTRSNGSRQHTRALRTPFGLAATITAIDKGVAADPVQEPGVPSPGVCYFHRNQVNSTTIVSDSHGAIVANVEYLPFGDISRIRGIQSFRAKFAGRELDHETGLYDFGARYYLPQIGRFITADDGFGGPLDRHDTLNPYAYVLNSPVCNVDPSGRNVFDAIRDGFNTVAGAVETGASWLKNNPKEWAPYVVSGLLVVGGIAILATTPFGGAASAAIGGMLLGAGISGIVYAATHHGDNFNWNSWGIQMGVGGAVGLVSGGLSFGATSASNALMAGGRAAFALGAAGRVALQVAAGVVDGAAGNAFAAWITNLDNGQSAGQGVGWAALVGGITGGVGAGIASKLAGSARFSRGANYAERVNFMPEFGGRGIANARVATSSGIIGKAVLRAPAMLFGAGGKALINFGPQQSW